MDGFNKTSPKPVMGVQGLIEKTSSSGNNNSTINNGNNTMTNSNANVTTPIAIPSSLRHPSSGILTRPPIVITSPSPHVSPSSVAKAVPRVPIPVSTTNPSQIASISTSSDIKAGTQSSFTTTAGASVTSVTPSAPASVSTGLPTATGGGQRSSTPVAASVTTASKVNPVPVVSSSSISKSTPVSAIESKVSQASVSASPVIVQSQGVSVSAQLPSLTQVPPGGISKPAVPQPNIPYAGRIKSGFVRLDHPVGPATVTGTSAANSASATDNTTGKAVSAPTPRQPSPYNSNTTANNNNHNNKQLINQEQNQNLINQSGNHFTPQVSSSVTTSTSSPTTSAATTATKLPTQKSNQPSTASSGTNPVLKSQTTATSIKKNISNPSLPGLPSVTGKMEFSTGCEEASKAMSQQISGQNVSVSKDVNLNLMTDSASGNGSMINEKSLINGKGDIVDAHKSITVESTGKRTNIETELPSRPVTAPASFDAPSSHGKQAIGKDLEMLITVLENSGLCGPPIPMETQSAPSSRPGTAERRPGTAESRPGTAESRPGTAESRPGTAERRPGTAERKSKFGYTAGGDGPEVRSGYAAAPPASGKKSSGATNVKSAKGDEALSKIKVSTRSPVLAGERDTPGKGDGTMTPTNVAQRESGNRVVTGRPPSASGGRSRPSTGLVKSSAPNGNAVNAVSQSHGTSPGKGTNTPNSSIISTPVEPKLAKSARTSTPRAASARLSQTQSSTLGSRTKSFDEESKLGLKNNNRNKSFGGSGSGNNSSQETRPKSAISANNNNSAPRSRPSSTLYQHTASSAQKGIQTPSPASLANISVGTNSSPGTPKTSRSSTRPRTARSKMGDSAATAAGDGKPATLKEQFAVFSRFGDTSSDGKHISLSNCDKWMKQAHVIDAKKITTTDTSICFKKLFKTAKKVSYEDFQKYIEDLAKSKKIEPQTILDKLTNCGAPGLSTATKAAHAGVVERLTDTSKYTGSHKERFDASGKGKGIEGRRDVPDGSGYVNSFKTKLDLNKSDSKESKESSPVPVKVPHPAVAKEASPPKV